MGETRVKDKLRVFVPKKLDSAAVNKLLVQVVKEDLECLYETVIFDFKELEWVEPSGITVLTNLFGWLKKQGIIIEISKEKKDHLSIWSRKYEAMKYLEDAGFFKLHGFEDNMYGQASLRSTMLPITQIAYENYVQWNNTDFLLYLQAQTHRSSEFSNILVAVQEIFNNIKNHSTVDIGCTFAQFYPSKNEICLSFSDFGIGIPNSVRHLNPELCDSELLEFAVREGVSTQSDPANRGAGLWNIVRGLTNAEVGRVYIRSNYGRIWYRDKEVYNKLDAEAFYPGTFFEIRLNTANPDLYDDDMEEDFGW